MLRLSACLAMLVAFVALPAGAAGPDPGTHRCALVDAPAERLACFDEAFPRPAGADEAEQAAGAAASAPAAAMPMETEEDFGLSEVERRARAPERARDSLDQIEATVVSVRHFSTGERIITLDNGQVWRQTEATVRGPLAEGDQVVIRKGAFSSFQLVTPGRVALRVRRVE